MQDPPSEFRFECTQCGQCCRRPGEVRFDDARLDAMATALGIDLETFRIRFDVHFTPERKEAWSFIVTENAPCPMLQGDLCQVHEVRPRQCRSYPFWPETTSSEAWAVEAAHCPGIGLGTPWPTETVAEIVEREARESDP